MERVRFFLLDADYVVEKDGTAVRLWGVTEDWKDIVVLKREDPFFFVEVSSKEAKQKIQRLLNENGMKVRSIEEVRRKLRGEEKDFLRISCLRPQDTQKARDIIKVLEGKRGGDAGVIEEYEYAINFYRRFLIKEAIDGSCWMEAEGQWIDPGYDVDLALQASSLKSLERMDLPQLRTLAFDIETLEEAGKKKIVMASLFGRDLRMVLTDRKATYPEWVSVVSDERELLTELINTIRSYRPHLLVTYYGDSFDFQVLDERCEAMKIKLILSRDKSVTRFQRRARVQSARFAGTVHVDVFNFVSNILSPSLQTEVLSLDAVSAELLGDRKIEVDYREMLEAWKKGKDLLKLANYCLKDAELTYRLFDLLLPQMLEISRTVGQVLFDTSRMTYGQLVEWYLSRKAEEEGEIIPNQPKFEEIQRRREETYSGGFVKEPMPGIHEDIAVLDFRSLYPSVIATYNISPETLNCPCCKQKTDLVPELPYWFCKQREGFVPRIVKGLMEKRQMLKKQMIAAAESERRLLEGRQHALKLIANATYGYFGFPASKWYCRECAESSTAYGRFWIKRTIQEAERRGFTVIYGDTDSLFLTSKGRIKEEVSSFLSSVNEEFPGYLELDLQGFYKRGIFIPKELSAGTAKKKYALLDEKGDLLIRGLETVRRDWCNLAKEAQRKVLEYVLREGNVAEAIAYVKRVLEKLRRKEVPLRDLIIYEELTKPLAAYKQIGPHVVAARKIKERGGEVEEGMIIMFVIKEGQGTISGRAEPVDFVSETDVDSNYYIEHQLLPPVLRILKVVGVDEPDLVGPDRPDR